MLFLLLSPADSAADTTSTADYSFDTSAFSTKPLDASASMEFYPALLMYNRDTPLYSLRFGPGNRRFADNYYLKTEGYLQYKHKPFFSFISGAL